MGVKLSIILEFEGQVSITAITATLTHLELNNPIVPTQMASPELKGPRQKAATPREAPYDE